MNPKCTTPEILKRFAILIQNDRRLEKAKVGHGGRFSNIQYVASDSILPPLKLAIRLKFFRDPVMPSRDSSSGDIEPPVQDDAGFSRHFPAMINRHITG